MNKQVVWSSAVFTLFVGSAAYVGGSAVLTSQAAPAAEPEAVVAEAPVPAPVKKLKVHAVRAVNASAAPQSAKASGA